MEKRIKPCPEGRWALLRIAFLEGLSTLTAPAVDYDTRTGAVGAENPILKFKAILLFTDRLFSLSLQFSAAFHTETALCRKCGSALGAFLSPYFVMAVWTLHFLYQLFLEVVT